ncbi:MAG: acyl-CoA thioesterase II [Nannocystaceae bacterium]|nr:acyl-CoA thioesterase II [Nannocystaceae bacterium]
MSVVLQELLEQLQLERLEQNLFRGQSRDPGWGTVYGGQVLGQALSAACQTVPTERTAHSLHGYFLRPGDVNAPIIYDVDCIRDGKSFTTRRVVAIQHGRAIFNMAASFQIAEDGDDHQTQMPEAPAPETLKSERELAETFADSIPEPLRSRVLGESPIEMRPVDPVNPLAPKKGRPHRQVWYRAAEALPDDRSVHQCLLAYASDSYLIGTALVPHGVSPLMPNMQVASLDHSMWFHRSFRLDEWLLYDMDSPSAEGARGMARGQFFDAKGRLVASTAQEGLMRRR